jgi:moderate conductance mechanosensitive channel
VAPPAARRRGLTDAVDVCEGLESPYLCERAFRASGQEWVARLVGQQLALAVEILLILLIAYVVNRVAQRSIKRFIRSMAENGVSRLGALRGRNPLSTTGPMNLARATMRTETMGTVLRSLASALIYGIALVSILSALGLDLGPLLAGAGVLGVALGFGAQNLVKDFLAGIFILLEDQYGIGDIVDVGEVSAPVASGVVEGITLRSTRLRDVNGTVWHVPNGEIRAVGNKSQLWARSLIDISVPYGTDVTKAMRVLKDVADELWHDEAWSDQVLEEPELWGVENLGPSEVTLRLVMKVEPARQWAINRELRARLLGAFEREAIEIADQRTVRVQDGDADEPAEHEGGAAAATVRAQIGRDWGPAQRP